jgi:hypothetical protein
MPRSAFEQYAEPFYIVAGSKRSDNFNIAGITGPGIEMDNPGRFDSRPINNFAH